MRKIKFRAWDLAKKMYAYDIQNEYDTCGGVRYWVNGEITKEEPGCDCFSSYLENEKFIVEQFTGQFDKNGKEIYEGDILKCCTLHSSQIGNSYENRAMRWLDEVGCYISIGVKDAGPYIIGNIHEAPELLK